MISTVEPGGLAGSAGVRPGDELLSVNGHPVADIIGFRFHASDTHLDILLRRSGHEFTVAINKGFDDSLGLHFATELFDGVRTCRNKCVFCFVDNLPPGMRRSLYVKDDDYRLSFLHGNFITLTNLDDADIERILEQRLSPLYVSIHATRPDLRLELLRGKTRPDVLPILRRLAQGGIRFHTQVVLCPGLNDGQALDETISDLLALHPAVMSVGVVPVGLTKYTKVQGFCRYLNTQAREILKQVDGWRRRCRTEIGTRFVFASDELYLLAGRKVPGSAAYEGFPQYENGIGILRSFKAEMTCLKRRLPPGLPREVSIGLITGRLAEPFVGNLAELFNEVYNIRAEVLAVDNDFFGHTVTVAGLITGGDIIAQLNGKGRDLPEVLLVPRVMLREDAFLDDVTLVQLAQSLGRNIVPIGPSPLDVESGLQAALRSVA